MQPGLCLAAVTLLKKMNQRSLRVLSSKPGAAKLALGSWEDPRVPSHETPTVPHVTPREAMRSAWGASLLGELGTHGPPGPGTPAPGDLRQRLSRGSPRRTSPTRRCRPAPAASPASDAQEGGRERSNCALEDGILNLDPPSASNNPEGPAVASHVPGFWKAQGHFPVVTAGTSSATYRGPGPIQRVACMLKPSLPS